MFVTSLILGSALLFRIFIPIAAVSHSNVKPTSFCYDEQRCGPSTWGGICKTGKEQSPIEIQEARRFQNFRTTSFRMNRQYLSQSRHVFFGQNTGHSVQYELNPDTSALSSDLKICGGHLGHCYRFAQFHFHWGETNREGSEHTINGVRHALELHLVHYRNKYKNFAEAINSKDREAVAVMAVLFKVGRHNRVFHSIIESLQSLREPGEVKRFNLPLRISDFYPDVGKFAHYNGSLTTPTCDEKVVWTVFLRPLEVSENQINQFRLLSNEEGVSDINFRPLQPLNGRKIEFFRANGFTEISSWGRNWESGFQDDNLLGQSYPVQMYDSGYQDYNQFVPRYPVSFYG